MSAFGFILLIQKWIFKIIFLGESDGGSPTEGARFGRSSGLRHLQSLEEERRSLFSNRQLGES